MWHNLYCSTYCYCSSNKSIFLAILATLATYPKCGYFGYYGYFFQNVAILATAAILATMAIFQTSYLRSRLWFEKFCKIAKLESYKNHWKETK